MPLPAAPVGLAEDRKQGADGPEVSGQRCIGHTAVEAVTLIQGARNAPQWTRRMRSLPTRMWLERCVAENESHFTCPKPVLARNPVSAPSWLKQQSGERSGDAANSVHPPRPRGDFVPARRAATLCTDRGWSSIRHRALLLPTYQPARPIRPQHRIAVPHRHQSTLRSGGRVNSTWSPGLTPWRANQPAFSSRT